MEYVLVDTGIWIAIFNERDQWHNEAVGIYESVLTSKEVKILLPWPVMYETLNTRTVRNPSFFEPYMEISRQSELIDDAAYRIEAIDTLGQDRQNLSLVDKVIQLMLQDTSLRIDYLATFNTRDFYRPCAERNITILDESWASM